MQRDQNSLVSELIQAYQDEVAAADRFRESCVAAEVATERSESLEQLQQFMKSFVQQRNRSRELHAEWQDQGAQIDEQTSGILDRVAKERTESLKRLLPAIRSAEKSLNLVRSEMLNDITELNRTTTIMKAYRN